MKKAKSRGFLYVPESQIGMGDGGSGLGKMSDVIWLSSQSVSLCLFRLSTYLLPAISGSFPLSSHFYVSDFSLRLG